jgi:hypothetical protein
MRRRLLAFVVEVCVVWSFVYLALRRGLEQILRQYVGHYNAERPHRGLDLAAPEPPRLRVRSRGPVARRDRLGGLIHKYYRKAA